MKIALIGGTGKEGKGIALRWAKSGHEVFIGSRQAERAQQCAQEMNPDNALQLHGGDNSWAVQQAEIALLSVPYSAHAATLQALVSELKGKTLIDITVPLAPPKVRTVHLPQGQAAALEAQAILGEDVAVVAALHHISSVHLSDPSHEIDCDVLVCSDSAEAKEQVMALISDLGLQSWDAGPLVNAIALESLTPVLLYVNKKYKGAGAGIRIRGLTK
jgi:8-hydroxy-5-deazaflavin:NADPH oxidoreductase